MSCCCYLKYILESTVVSILLPFISADLPSSSSNPRRRHQHHRLVVASEGIPPTGSCWGHHPHHGLPAAAALVTAGLDGIFAVGAKPKEPAGSPWTRRRHQQHQERRGRREDFVLHLVGTKARLLVALSAVAAATLAYEPVDHDDDWTAEIVAVAASEEEKVPRNLFLEEDPRGWKEEKNEEYHGGRRLDLGGREEMPREGGACCFHQEWQKHHLALEAAIQLPPADSHLLVLEKIYVVAVAVADDDERATLSSVAAAAAAPASFFVSFQRHQTRMMRHLLLPRHHHHFQPKEVDVPARTDSVVAAVVVLFVVE